MTKYIFDLDNDSDTDSWTTGRIIDELFSNLANVRCEVKILGNDGLQKSIRYKKYYRQVRKIIYRIPIWRPTPIFIIYISDLTQKVKKNLEFYLENASEQAFRYIVTEAVGRLFENVDSDYYHGSVMKNLNVRFENQ